MRHKGVSRAWLKACGGLVAIVGKPAPQVRHVDVTPGASALAPDGFECNTSLAVGSEPGLGADVRRSGRNAPWVERPGRPAF